MRTFKKLIADILFLAFFPAVVFLVPVIFHCGMWVGIQGERLGEYLFGKL